MMHCISLHAANPSLVTVFCILVLDSAVFQKTETLVNRHLGCSPLCLQEITERRSTSSFLHSQDLLLFLAFKVSTQLETKTFKFAAPHSWNELQKDLKLKDLVSLNNFRTILSYVKTEDSFVVFN